MTVSLRMNSHHHDRLLSTLWILAAALGVIAVGDSIMYGRTPTQLKAPFDVWSDTGSVMPPVAARMDDVETSVTTLHSRLALKPEQSLAWDQFELAVRRADDARKRFAAGLAAVDQNVDSLVPAVAQKRAETLAALFSDRARSAQSVMEAAAAFKTVLDEDRNRTFETYAIGVYERAIGPSGFITTERHAASYAYNGPIPSTPYSVVRP